MNTQNTPLLKFKEKLLTPVEISPRICRSMSSMFLMVYLTDVFGLNAAAVDDALCRRNLGCN